MNFSHNKNYKNNIIFFFLKWIIINFAAIFY